jgi:hypothetical protein
MAAIRSGARLQPALAMPTGPAAPLAAEGQRARGDIRHNRDPSVGGPARQICVAGGTPGTWHPEGIVGAVQAAAPAVTYVEAAGGATVDAELRAAVALLAADLADMRTKLATAKLTA